MSMNDKAVTVVDDFDAALAQLNSCGELAVKDRDMAEALHARVAFSVVIEVTKDGFFAGTAEDVSAYVVALQLTPEDLTADPSRVPSWAKYASAVRVASKVDAYDLYRSHNNLPPEGLLIGCMYDMGEGYVFVEGQSIGAGDRGENRP